MPVAPKSSFDKVVALNWFKFITLLLFAFGVTWLLPDKDRADFLKVAIPVL
jgi:hypothetical protein